MEYRTLGRTGEKVSTIGMGTWRIGAEGGHLNPREVESLRRGFEIGVNLVDTAEMYSSGNSEATVGGALEGMRDKVFVATKVSPSNLGYDDVVAACGRSLQRLRVSQIDLYQVHWPNPQIPIRETMKAMEKLADQGKIRHIGVSNFSVEQTREAMESLSKYELASNQVEYSLTNRSVETSLMPFCRKENVALIAYSPLSRGNIQDSLVPRSLVEKYSMTSAQVTLNWLTREEGTFAIPKSAQAKHIEENASSVSVRFTRREYDEMTEGLAIH